MQSRVDTVGTSPLPKVIRHFLILGLRHKQKNQIVEWHSSGNLLCNFKMFRNLPIM